MEDIKLSKKGNALIKLYQEMVAKGIDRVDGTGLKKKTSIIIFNLGNSGIYVNLIFLMRK